MDAGQNVPMDGVTRAHDAFRARDWQGAYDAFRSATQLGGDDYDALGETAHWLGRPEEAVDAYTEAYRAHCDAGESRKAALSAFMLAIHLRLQGDGARSDGWIARSHRLLAGAEEG